MAERKATNKYYPPEWTPDKGSLNTFRGSHPLRERAKKIKQGIIVVRFELPYNIWCDGCGSHVGMGVRYNAEKSRVGSYYSTPIFKFRMKCHLCDSYFEIQTDPKNCDYVVVSGASRKNERWHHKDGETMSVPSHEEAQKRVADPMFQLEHSVQDSKKGNEEAPQVHQLQMLQEQKKDDFAINQLLRKRLREEKKEQLQLEDRDRQLQERACISIPLAPESEEDSMAAKRVAFASSSASTSHKSRRRLIKAQSVFSDRKSSQLAHSLRMDHGIFRKPNSRLSTASSSGSGVAELRSMLGIQPRTPSK